MTKHLNYVHLIGELSNSPKTHVFSSGEVTNFTLLTVAGTNKTYHHCTAWSDNCKLPEGVDVGSLLEIEGYFKVSSYEDKNTKEKKFSQKVICTTIKLCKGEDHSVNW